MSSWKPASSSSQFWLEPFLRAAERSCLLVGRGVELPQVLPLEDARHDELPEGHQRHDEDREDDAHNLRVT